MIITTAFDEAEALVLKAKELALELGIAYYPRRKNSVKHLLEQGSSQVFVVNGHRGLSYYERADEEVFFHPNMAFLRIKQLSSGQGDSFISACQLKEGMTLFDGTLGLASDSLVASYVVGDTGKVVSVEKSFPLSVIVKEGLTFYGQKFPLWAPLIERLNIKNADNLDYLRDCHQDQFDVVYFDFMFNRPVKASKGIQVISSLTIKDIITNAHVEEAKRVAKRRVVVKANGEKEELEKLGFKVEKVNQRRHFFYAVIELR